MELAIAADDRWNTDNAEAEVVERKGLGHPDTMADRIAERVSQTYSKYCLDNFGLILHHNADKTALLGGRAAVRFGGGEMVDPVLALVNGRFTAEYDGRHIPVQDIIDQAVRDVCDDALLHFDCDRDLRVTTRNNTTSSPGAVEAGSAARSSGTRSRWFAPRGPQDVTPARTPHSNDTSCGVGYAPRSRLEQFVLELEPFVRATGNDAVANSIGTDIKVMANRIGDRLRLTMAVPVIDAAVPDLAAYRSLLAHVADAARAKAGESGFEPTVTVNARDKPEIPELYLTVTGSSIENGDEGVVGRGNRCNGLITPMRPMSIEGACGKNPVYHIGKLYNVLAQMVAEELSMATGGHVAVTMVSVTGAPLVDPGFVSVVHSGQTALPQQSVREAVDRVMSRLPDVQEHLALGKISLF